MVAVTGSSEGIARQTLDLYFEPDRGVMPRQGRIDMAGLTQVIAFMGEGGMVQQPMPPVWIGANGAKVRRKPGEGGDH